MVTRAAARWDLEGHGSHMQTEYQSQSWGQLALSAFFLMLSHSRQVCTLWPFSCVQTHVRSSGLHKLVRHGSHSEPLRCLRLAAE